ncbi:MAG: inositol monophosphatase family protein [Candidatus Hodarchaeota archaeon]
MKKYLKMLLDIADKVREETLSLLSSDLDIGGVVGLNPSETLTRKIDEAAEKVIVEALLQYGIPTYLISEELGERFIGGEKAEIALVVDPIDGSTNAVTGIPFYSTSLALGKYRVDQTIDSLSVGVVKNLVSDETFHAVKGEGAFWNKKRIFTSKDTKIDEALVSFYAYRSLSFNSQHYELCKSVKTRTLGSEALEICYVAKGSLDACIDVRGYSRVVDIAAAKVVLEEAGGIFADLQGKKHKAGLSPKDGFSFIAVSNETILTHILSVFGN